MVGKGLIAIENQATLPPTNAYMGTGLRWVSTVKLGACIRSPVWEGDDCKKVVLSMERACTVLLL